MPSKNYSKTGVSCKVTFSLPSEVKAKAVSLCGDFNNWDKRAHPMKKRKDGRWSITISLKSGNAYRYKYFIDGNHWENDWKAEGYLSNSFGTEDSLITL